MFSCITKLKCIMYLPLLGYLVLWELFTLTVVLH